MESCGVGGIHSHVRPQSWRYYIEVYNKGYLNKGSLNIKRLLLNKEYQISQIKEFSTFLCMGKRKSLGSLKSFLSCIPAILWSLPSVFHILSSSGLTTGSGCSLKATRSHSSPFWVHLRLRNSHLEGWNCWCLWYPCFTDMAGNTPVVNSNLGNYPMLELKHFSFLSAFSLQKLRTRVPSSLIRWMGKPVCWHVQESQYLGDQEIHWGRAASPYLPGGSDSKESACIAGDEGLIPGWGIKVPEWLHFHFTIFKL